MKPVHIRLRKPPVIPVAEILEEAEAVLRKPDDFCYYGLDRTLWKTSGLTLLRHRDSADREIAVFEKAWRTLCAEFPDLAPADGVDRMEQNPGRLYVIGFGHWAVGHIDQIVVPVLHNPGLVTPENIHPAFVRVLELAEVLAPPARPQDQDSGSPRPLTLVRQGQSHE